MTETIQRAVMLKQDQTLMHSSPSSDQIVGNLSIIKRAYKFQKDPTLHIPRYHPVPRSKLRLFKKRPFPFLGRKKRRTKPQIFTSTRFINYNLISQKSDSTNKKLLQIRSTQKPERYKITEIVTPKLSNSIVTVQRR